jgi:hypothetical protein
MSIYEDLTLLFDIKGDLPRRSEDSPVEPLPPDKLLDIYKDISANIRVTDDISFKLLGIVLLTSGVGAGALTILEKSKLLEGYTGFAVIVLSAVGALITLGLFRWELWNIRKCTWFIARATNFERATLGVEHRQFDGMVTEAERRAETLEKAPLAKLRDRPWDKTQAEKLVYPAAIGAWLVPFAIAPYNLFSPA